MSVFFGFFFGPLLKGTCRLLFTTHGGEYRMQPCVEQVSRQGWKQRNYTVPPWARWASPHGTHREHHSWENTVKLPDASPTLVLSTRDSTLTACSYLAQSGKSLYGHECCVLWFLCNEAAWEPCAVTECQRERPALSSPGHKNDWRLNSELSVMSLLKHHLTSL